MLENRVGESIVKVNLLDLFTMSVSYNCSQRVNSDQSVVNYLLSMCAYAPLIYAGLDSIESGETENVHHSVIHNYF